MNMDSFGAPRPRVEVVDILSNNRHVMVSFQLSESKVTGIWFDRRDFPSPHIVKIQNPLWIALQRHRRANVFDSMPGPQSVTISKRLDP